MKRILAPLLASCFSLLASAAQPPNIIFIAIDDLKPDLGCYGNTLVKTPNFDRLAAMGTTFTNAHCNQAVCGPSRASLMTSLRPDRTRVHDLHTKIRTVTPWVTTLPQHLKSHGYTTVGTGKIYDPRSVDNKSDAPSWSQPFRLYNLDYNPNFPHPVAAAYQGAKYHAALKEIQARGLKGYNAIYKALKAKGLHDAVESADVPDDAYTDGAIRKEGIKFIHKLAPTKKPFFIAIGFKKPHLPFIAPKKYWDLYKRSEMPLAPFQKHAKNSPAFAYHNFPELHSYGGIPKTNKLPEDKQRELIHGYYACISYIDAQLGLILDELENKKLLDNTIIVLWGDHGWHLGDHGLWTKHTNYEQATRAPLIIAGPGIAKGLKTNAPTEFIDIFPTLCELAHVPMAENRDGISFAPILTGAKKSIRPFAISQFPRGKTQGYALRDTRYRYVIWLNNSQPIGAKSTPTSTINNIRAEELYDYQTDPLETQNIAADPAQATRIKTFRKAIQQFLTNQKHRIEKNK